MQNKDNSIRIVKEITKEYGRKILDEGSKSVRGFENYVDKMIAKILDIESEIVTVAREWRSVLERAAMIEGIDKVKIVLGQQVEDLTNKRVKNKTTESIINIEIETSDQMDLSNEEEIKKKVNLE